MPLHLTVEQLDGYQQNALGPEELLRVGEHLAECAECARRASVGAPARVAARAWSDSLTGQREDPHLHPEDEELFAYLDGELESSARDAVRLHLESCPGCSADLQDLREFRARMSTYPRREYAPGNLPEPERPPSGWRRFLLPAATAVGASLAAGALVYALGVEPLRRELFQQGAAMARLTMERNTAHQELSALRRQAGSVPGSDPRAGQEVARLRAAAELARKSEAELRRKLAQAGGAGAAPTPRQTAVAVTDLPAEPPDTLRPLLQRGGTLMGSGSDAPKLSLRAPTGTLVLSPRPTFRWTPVPGATAYGVGVFDESFTEVAKSPHVAGTEWTPDRDLPRGKTYRWEVTALRGDQEVERAPKPPAPAALFRVMDPKSAAAAGRERAAAALEAARRSAAAGLLADAERELEKVSPENGAAPEQVEAARKLRAQMERWRAAGPAP